MDSARVSMMPAQLAAQCGAQCGVFARAQVDALIFLKGFYWGLCGAPCHPKYAAIRTMKRRNCRTSTQRSDEFGSSDVTPLEGFAGSSLITLLKQIPTPFLTS